MVKLDEDNRPGYMPDDNQPEWYEPYKQQPDDEDLEDLDNVPVIDPSELPITHPDHPKNKEAAKKVYSDGELAGGEQNGAAMTDDAAAASEKNKLPGDAFSYTGDVAAAGVAAATATTPVGFAARMFARMFTKRNAGIGGAVIGTTAIFGFMFFGFSAYEAVHVREHMMDQGNALVNRALENRRNKSFTRVLRKMNNKQFGGALLNDKFDTKLRRRGFIVERGPDKTLTKLAFQSIDDPSPNGFREFNFAESDLRTAYQKFFGGGFLSKDKLGKEITRNFDQVTGFKANTWLGKQSRKFYGSYGIHPRDWWNSRKPSEPGNASRSFAETTAADDARNTEPTKTTGQAGEIGKDNNNDGVRDENTVLNQVDDVNDPTLAKVAAARANGDNTSDILGISNELADNLAEQADGVANKSITSTKLIGLLGDLGSKIPSLAAKTTKLQELSEKLDLVDPVRIACRVKGTLNVIANIRNVFLAIQLARFAMRFATAADHQQAGLITGQGLGILMAYMHNKNPLNGKSYNQAGGFQNVIMGNTTARPTKANLSRYSVGREDTGIFGVIRGLVDQIPSGVCRFINNGLVQVGTLVISLAAALVPGGAGIKAGSLAFGFALGVLEEATFQLATPLIIGSLTNSLINGYENGEMAGDALGSGWGSLRGMTAGSNGTRPASKRVARNLSYEATAEHQDKLARMSLYDRYLSPQNADSFASMAALNMPSYLAPGVILKNPASLFSSLAKAIPFTNNQVVHAQAEDEDTCGGDKLIKEYDLQTDIFCNIEMADVPDIDTDQTEQILLNHKVMLYHTVDKVCVPDHEVDAPLIDKDGYAIPYENGDMKCDDPTIRMSDDFGDYVEHCHSGRPGILYDMSNLKDPTSATGGEPIKDRMKVHIDGPNNDVDAVEPCLDMGTSNNHLPLEKDTISRFDRYTDWCGYMGDRDNLIQDINDDFGGQGLCGMRPESSGTRTTAEEPDALNALMANLNLSDLGLGGASGAADATTLPVSTPTASPVSAPHTPASDLVASLQKYLSPISNTVATGRTFVANNISNISSTQTGLYQPNPVKNFRVPGISMA